MELIKNKTNRIKHYRSRVYCFCWKLKNGSILEKDQWRSFKRNFTISLLEDNQSCIKWLKNATGYHAKTKHIEICYHFARELYQEDLLHITYVSSENQVSHYRLQNTTIFLKSWNTYRIQVECEIIFDRSLDNLI